MAGRLVQRPGVAQLPLRVLRGVVDAELLHLTVGDGGKATSFDEQGAVGVRSLKESERSVAHATDDCVVGDRSRGLLADDLGTAEIPGRTPTAGEEDDVVRRHVEIADGERVLAEVLQDRVVEVTVVLGGANRGAERCRVERDVAPAR